MSKPLTQHTLESLLAKTVEEGECLLWTGSLQNKVPMIYAPHFVTGKPTMVSVRALMVHFTTGQPLKAGYYRATCGHRTCVNPDHVAFGTESDHIKHMAKRSNTGPGSLLRRLKVSESKRRVTDEQIHDMLHSNETADTLAKRHGVSVATVKKYRTGRAFGSMSNPFVGLIGAMR